MNEDGPELQDLWPRRVRGILHYSYAKLCPICGADLSRTALVELCYTWVVCECGREPEHLREQVWHKRCFKETS